MRILTGLGILAAGLGARDVHSFVAAVVLVVYGRLVAGILADLLPR